MSVFKKKRRKKQKPQVKKSVPATSKSRPQQWTPPFPGAGKRKENKPIDDVNAIPDIPKVVEAKPTYILPPPPKVEESAVSDTVPIAEPVNNEVRPRDQKARKEFLKTFGQLTHRWRSWDIWTDFVTMTACALSNIVDITHYDEREEIYMRTINKYSKEEQQLFPELFAQLVIALDENPEQDFLGDIYNELGLNSKEHRQIFTPYHLAHMMAMITIDNIEEEIADKGFVTVHDCCCGGGVTLIAAANVVRDKLTKSNLNFQNHLLVTGQDIDYVVAMMCCIQLSLLGVAGYFKVGNALTEPMSSDDNLDNYWFTPMYFFPVWHFRRTIRELDRLFQTEQSTDLEQ